MMCVARAIVDQFTFKEACEFTCSKAGIQIPSQQLIQSAAIYSHKVFSGTYLNLSLQISEHPRAQEHVRFYLVI